jgi:CRP/FNR family cyclic AMP-dependent transcriptional regulator
MAMTTARLTLAPVLCHLLREDPDLGEAIPSVRRDRAIEECIAPTLRLPRGEWLRVPREPRREDIGLLVLDGVLIRRVGVDGRFGAELLGEGDLLRPWQGEDDSPALRRTTRWQVLEPVRLADLDARVAQRLARYPELMGPLVGRALGRSRNLAINMAIVHQARVEVRLHMLLWHLADRWGKVTRSGVVLPLTLTHTVLADLVAARRPTVTTALGDLIRRELIRPLEAGWRLCGDPPSELLELRSLEDPSAR